MHITNLQASAFVCEWTGLEGYPAEGEDSGLFAEWLDLMGGEKQEPAHTQTDPHSDATMVGLLVGMNLPVPGVFLPLPEGEPALSEPTARAPQAWLPPQDAVKSRMATNPSATDAGATTSPEQSAGDPFAEILQHMTPASEDSVLPHLPEQPDVPTEQKPGFEEAVLSPGHTDRHSSEATGRLPIAEPIATPDFAPVPEAPHAPSGEAPQTPSVERTGVANEPVSAGAERNPQQALERRVPHSHGEPLAHFATGVHSLLHGGGVAILETSTPPSGELRWESVEQIAQHIERLGHRPGEQSITLQLDPPEWGRIEIRVQVEGTEVHTWLTTEHDFARRALEQAAQSLREQLAQRGLQLGAFSVGTGSHHASRRPTSTPYETTRSLSEPTRITRHATESIHLLGRWSAWA